MDNKIIHDLATAYAQAELIQYQNDHPNETGYDSKIKAFLESYYFASAQIPLVDDSLDRSKFY